MLFCDLRFHEVYNNIRQAVKKMEWNWESKMRQNTDKKPYRLLFMCGYKYVCVYILFYFITHTPPMRPTIYNIYAIFHSFIISTTTIYYAHIYYLTPLLLFTPFLFYFILLHTYHLWDP